MSKKQYLCTCEVSRAKLNIRNLSLNMAIAIKAIPTLHGEDAIRFREEIEKVDKEYDLRPKHNLTQDPRYAMMKKILSKARLF